MKILGGKFFGKFRNSEIEVRELVNKDQRFAFNLIGSYLQNADLNMIDLVQSTFVSSSLINCRWPEYVGKTGFTGRFDCPENLLCQPINDVGGVPDNINREINRFQKLHALEVESERSTSTKVLHRLLGLATGHGRDPFRLILFTLIPAFILTIVHSVIFFVDRFFIFLGKKSTFGGNKIFSINDFSDFILTMYNYFTIIVGYGDRKEIENYVFLELTAWGLSIIFIGLVVTLFANNIFRQG